jgi:hypothetical protein
MTTLLDHDHEHDERIAAAVAAGRLAILEARPRGSGLLRAPVAFAERPDGSLVVVAHDATAPWADTLRAEPRCRHETRGIVLDDVARELLGQERTVAAAELAVAYGSAIVPSTAPVFELQPIELDDATAPSNARGATVKA